MLAPNWLPLSRPENRDCLCHSADLHFTQKYLKWLVPQLCDLLVLVEMRVQITSFSPLLSHKSLQFPLHFEMESASAKPRVMMFSHFWRFRVRTRCWKGWISHKSIDFRPHHERISNHSAWHKHVMRRSLASTFPLDHEFHTMTRNTARKLLTSSWKPSSIWHRILVVLLLFVFHCAGIDQRPFKVINFFIRARMFHSGEVLITLLRVQ